MSEGGYGTRSYRSRHLFETPRVPSVTGRDRNSCQRIQIKDPHRLYGGNCVCTIAADHSLKAILLGASVATALQAFSPCTSRIHLMVCLPSLLYSWNLKYANCT
jgi:hypothetical protein